MAADFLAGSGSTFTFGRTCDAWKKNQRSNMVIKANKDYVPLLFVEEFAVEVFASEESVTELSSKVSSKASFPGYAPWAFSFF